jgi:hypothetical protein
MADEVKLVAIGVSLCRPVPFAALPFVRCPVSASRRSEGKFLGRRLQSLAGTQANLKGTPAAWRVPLPLALDDPIRDLIDNDPVDSQDVRPPQQRAVRLEAKQALGGGDQQVLFCRVQVSEVAGQVDGRYRSRLGIDQVNSLAPADDDETGPDEGFLKRKALVAGPVEVNAQPRACAGLDRYETIGRAAARRSSAKPYRLHPTPGWIQGPAER